MRLLRIPFASRCFSTSSRSPLLLSTSQLADIRKSGQNAALLDASWFMPNSARNASQEFFQKRLPGAQFLDLDAVASPHELGLKHMMPTERVFASYCAKAGIAPDTQVVLYDSTGIFSSPRALFMFRSFGHANSSVLDGGLPRWEHERLPVETGDPSIPVETSYSSPKLNIRAIRTYDEMVSNSAKNPELSELVLDARSRERFTGADPEPRPGISSGHIPNSISLPFNTFLQKHEDNGLTYTTFLPLPALRERLVEAIGVEKFNAVLSGGTRIITTCGSGMTAGVLWLGLKLLGVPHIALYDESWTGYALRPTSKIVKRPL